MARRRSPRNHSEKALARVGVALVSWRDVGLRCTHCGQFWSPMLIPGRGLPRLYWICPNGCNHPAIKD